ncbi:MAG: class IV adenylate cyclase [Patescibacteria group bacterium]|jgi:adenylate cyclase class 2
MKEIEILVEVFDDQQSALTKLEKFNFKGLKDTYDIYYFDPQRKNLQPVSKGILRECFRLRNKNNEYYLTYKINQFEDSGDWLYSEEHEIKISDFDTAVNIINNLGLKKLVEVKSHKNYFVYDNYEIMLEEVENLGLFLEVEIINSENTTDVKKAKTEIWEFMKSLNLKMGEELLIGKPELMLKKINHGTQG